MKLRTCYRTLGLPPGASLQAIKRAYRKLARQWHPDRFPEDRAKQQAAAERFKSIHAAYDRLCAASERERAALRSVEAPPSTRASVPVASSPTTGRPPVAQYGRDGRRDRVRQRTAHRVRRRGPIGGGRPSYGSAGKAERGAHEPAHAPEGRGAHRAASTEWGGIVFVAGAVGVFCLGLLYSTTLAGMLAWAATWTVLAAGVLARVRPAEA